MVPVFSSWPRLTRISTLLSLALGLASPSLQAVEGTTSSTGVLWENAVWVNDPPEDPAIIPGATSGTTNTDTATFEGASITVDAYRNIQNIVLVHGNGTTLTGGTLYLTAGGALARDSQNGGGGGAGGSVGSTVNSDIVLLGDYTFENLNANARFLRFGMGGTNTIAGAAGTGDTSTLTLQGISTLMSGSNALLANIVNSAIGDGSGGGKLALEKSGTGIWVLSGDNTYTGTTTVNEGSLYIANRASLYNGNTAAWTAANIVVQSGATLGVRVGGTSNITASDVQALIGAGSATGGFLSGSTFAFDTILGDFSYSHNIANPNSGTNVLALVKRGPNTLTLSGNSTYTGGTTILGNGGNLRVESNNALGSGPLTINDPGSGGGQATGGTLQLAGGINLAVASITLGPAGATRNETAAPHIENVSGNNTISANITYSAASGVISSASGKLTLSGTITTSNPTGTGTTQKLLYLTGAGMGEITGRIQNGSRPVAVHKYGNGTWILSNPLNNNDYAGDTQVHAGTLLINTSNSSATGAVTVNAGGTLGGSGTVGGATTFAAGSFLSPGEAAGTAGILTFNNAVDISGLAGGTDGGLKFQLGTTADQIVLTSGVLTIGSGLLDINDFDFVALSGFGVGTYTLFDTTQTITGSLGSNLTAVLGSYNVELRFANSNQDLVLSVTAIPEPSTVLLLGLGALALGVRRFRRGTPAK